MTPQRTSGSDSSPGREDVLRRLREEQIDLLRLQFSDLAGGLRQLDVPARRSGEALDGGVSFDGAAAGGWREETELLLRPDPGTFCLLPSGAAGGRVARLICEVDRTDGTPFEGDPRGVLRRVVREVEAAGFRASIASEIEFFLLAAGGAPATAAAAGEAVRRDVVAALEEMGIAVATAFADAGPGQHEIDLQASDPVAAADALATLKPAVRAVAERHGLRATFMPKPIFGRHGCGLHLQHRLCRGEANAFADPDSMDGLSDALRGYVGGILRHARGFAAITNPLVNSYKRLIPGFAAPLYASWSLHDSSPLVRVPSARGGETGCEVRLADPAASPYLALAVQMAAGLSGVESEIDPGSPVGKQQGVMSARELQRRRIPQMPRHLGEALQALEESREVRGALGEYVFSHFVQAKREEWEEYVAQVHAWEVERYLDV
jgi:glutamine synthetase